MEINIGYEITKTVLFNNGRGIALGHNPKEVAPFVTWQFNHEQESRDYYWGRYFNTEEAAIANFKRRTTDYLTQYLVMIVEPALYQYDCLQRPTQYPEPIGNEPEYIVFYEKPRCIESGDLAWGALFYTRPLIEEHVVLYGLRPSPNNPEFERQETDKPGAIPERNKSNRNER